MNTNSILSALFATLNVPVVDVSVGHTGYLDAHVTPTSPIAKGVDRSGRKFFQFCVEGPTRLGMAGMATGVVTIFQRYSNSEDVWTQANNSGEHISVVEGAVTPQEARSIVELLETGKTTMWHEKRFPSSFDNEVMTRPSGVCQYDGRPLVAVGHALQIVPVSSIEVAA